MTPKNEPKKPARKAKFIDPPNILREKIGRGGIEPTRLEKAEEFIDTNPLNFVPFAERMIEKVDEGVRQAKSGKVKGKKAVDMLSRPIMELKANGGMFKYMLVSHLADIVLNFLETIDNVDSDVLEIIAAHQNALNVIISNELQGTGGKEGMALANELDSACKRYYKKHGVETR